MTSEEKQDKILEVLYSLKPIVEESRDDLKAVAIKVNFLEVRYAQIDERLNRTMIDLDAVGQKLREHISDSKIHSGERVSSDSWLSILTVGAFILERWKLFSLILAGVLAMLGISVTIHRGGQQIPLAAITVKK